MIPFSRSLAVKTIKVQRHEKGFRFGSNYSKGKDSGWHHFLLGCYTLPWLGTKGNWTRESTPRLTVIQKVTPHVPRHKRSCYFDLRHREACIGVHTWRKETSHAWIWTGLVLNFGQIETHWLDRWGTFELQPFFLDPVTARRHWCVCQHVFLFCCSHLNNSNLGNTASVVT